MKVYVMQRGQYSDRHIVGVVDDEEKAKTICSMLDAFYSEWDTNQFDVSNCLRFTVHNPDTSYTGDWMAELDDYDIYDEYKENGVYYDGFYVIYANSPDEAIRIAQDMEAQIKAERAGL